MSSFAFDSFKFKGFIKTIQPIYVDTPKQRGLPINVDGARFVPASTIRGALRHSAHNVASMYLASKGELLDLESHFALAIGYDLNHKAGPTNTVAECGYYFKGIREKNAFISLFGRWMLSSRLGVGNAFSKDPDAIIESSPMYRQNFFEKKPDLISLLDVPSIESLESILMSSSKNYNGDTLEVAKIQKKIKEYRMKINSNSMPMMNDMYKSQIEAFEAELASILRSNKTKQISKEVDSIEMFKSGIKLQHEMSVKNVSVNEFQTMIFAIYALSLNPYIGARFSTGLGQIEAEWEIHKFNIFNVSSELIGKVGFNESGFYAEINDQKYCLSDKGIFNPKDYYELLDTKIIDLSVNF